MAIIEKHVKKYESKRLMYFRKILRAILAVLVIVFLIASFIIVFGSIGSVFGFFSIKAVGQMLFVLIITGWLTAIVSFIMDLMKESIKENDASLTIESEEIHKKWEKYKKEEMLYDAFNKINVVSYSFGSIFFLIAMGAMYFGNVKILILFSALLGITVVSGCFFYAILEDGNTNKKKEFYKGNKEKIIFLGKKETSELTNFQQENGKNIFLIINSEVDGLRKQTYLFSTKSEKGNELKEFEKDFNSECFYREVNNFEDGKPRLEVEKNIFASKSLESEFNSFVSDSEFSYTQYTFFIPEGSVKKHFQ